MFKATALVKLSDVVPLELSVVNAPVPAVLPPILTPSIVPVVPESMVTVPDVLKLTSPAVVLMSVK